MSGLPNSSQGFRAALRSSWGQRRGQLSQRLVKPDPAVMVGLDGGRPSRTGKIAPAQRLRRLLLGKLLREIELQRVVDLGDADQVVEHVANVVDAAIEEDHALSLDERERRHVVEDLVADIRGLGPIDKLFSDPTVSDILVNGPDEVWVDRFGKLERTRVHFDDEEHLRRLLGRLVATHGRHLDEASPYVDVRLADGSRLHALLPPLCAAPTLSIRRARSVPFRLDELYACGTLTPAMGAFLEAVVRAGLNVVIAGGAASGKTTLLNVLSFFIPHGERVITIEETAELKLHHPHVIGLEARMPNVEGRGEVTLRTLVKNSLRMRADRLIVGEVRGPEVFDMLQAMNVGHDGSLTTVHANSPRDALRRLENLVLMGGFELPSRAIRELLAAALDLVIHITRFHDGTRRITSIREVCYEADTFETIELFRYADGAFEATGAEPSFAARLEAVGYRAAKRRAR